jgi:hypothetical protein
MRSNERLSIIWTLVGGSLAAVMLAGCSDLYFDRRETVSFHAGDAPAANKAAQTVDPWPAAAANRTIYSSGERMQRAVERYRTGKTTPIQSSPNRPVQSEPLLAPATTAPAQQ